MNSFLPEGITMEVAVGERRMSSRFHGVKPLLDLIESGEDCRGGSIKDRVSGRAAALLYLYLGFRHVETELISEGALALLLDQGVSVVYVRHIPAILNHARTDFCPLEKATNAITSPEEGLRTIQKTLREMNGK